MRLGILNLKSIKTRITFASTAIFVFGIWVLSYYAGISLQKDAKKLLGEQQASTLAYISSQIDGEIQDRIRILGLVSSRVDGEILGSPKKLQQFLDERLILKEPFSGGVIVVDKTMKVIAETPSGFGRIGIDYSDRDYLREMFVSAKPRVSGPVIGKKPNTPAFGIAVPIVDKNQKAIGAFIGITYLDKPNFLDHITQNKYGASGYYLLEEPKSRLIVTCTDKSRIMQKLPAPGQNYLIDRHANGYEETGITVNPLGVEVLASSKNIKSAGWVVVAALPTKEAFAPIVDMQKRIIGIALLLTIISGAAIWLMVRTELRQATQATEILKSSTDLKEPLPAYGDDEITTLINGFNKLLKALNIREEELKSLVESEVLKRLDIEDKRQKEQTALIQNEKMAQLGNMLGAIIHQWKQPLNSISIEVQDIKYAYSYGELNDEKIDEIVSKIMGIIGFMIKTADDFRNFYKPSKERKDFHIIEEIESVSNLLSRQLQNMNIKLCINGDKSLTVNGCAGEFKQVILNLLNNSKEAFESGGKEEGKEIDINVFSVEGKTVLTVIDNAGGISPELLKEGLFEQFSSTKGESGTGIGLAISKTIIEEHMGGKISVKNVNGGAEFTIELPTVVG